MRAWLKTIEALEASMDKPAQRDDEEKPVPPHEREQPTTPADPAEKPKEEYPRRMRWPADFPAKH